MAPFGSDFPSSPAADSAGSKARTREASNNLLMSWYDEPESSPDLAENTTTTAVASSVENRSSASLAAMTEVLNSQRRELRKFVFDDPISGRSEKRADNLSAVVADKAIASALEASLGRPAFKPSNLLDLTGVARPERPVDQPFSLLKQLEDPGSASSRWMFNNRPDLAQQFNSDSCSLQIGSQPDGTVFKILTSPEGNRWMLTAKGSATVETLADSTGQVLFKNSGRTAALA